MIKIENVISLRPKKKRVYLHIGGEKTGTTTLQTFLTENAENLKIIGIIYPNNHNQAYFEHIGHFPLAASLTLDDDPMEFVSHSKKCNIEFALNELIQDLQNSPEQIAIISCEHFSSRAKDAKKIINFRDALQQIFDDIKIIFYLREQSSLALSSFSTAVRHGRRDDFDPEAVNIDDPYFNHLLMLDFLASIFGSNNIIIRKYSKESLVNGDICEDFCKVISVPFSSELFLPKRENESLDFLQLQVLIKLNQFMPTVDEDIEGFRAYDRLRNNVVLPRLYSSPQRRVKLNSYDRSRIVDRFKPANKELIVKYLDHSPLNHFFEIDINSESEDDDFGQEDIDKAVTLSFSKITLELALSLQKVELELHQTQLELHQTQLELHHVYGTKAWRVRQSILRWRKQMKALFKR